MADPDYRFFDGTTLVVFRAIAAQVVPSEPDSPGADSEACLRITDAALASRPHADRKLLATFLRAVEWVPVLRFGRRFSRLDGPRQTRFLTWLSTNTLVPKLRAGFFGVKTYALMGYYGSDACFEELGYPGPRQDAPYYTLRSKEGQGP